jgi:hypothetical protein
MVYITLLFRSKTHQLGLILRSLSQKLPFPHHVLLPNAPAPLQVASRIRLRCCFCLPNDADAEGSVRLAGAKERMAVQEAAVTTARKHLLDHPFRLAPPLNSHECYSAAQSRRLRRLQVTFARIFRADSFLRAELVSCSC